MNGVKFGEASAHNGGGNPELSLGVPDSVLWVSTQIGATESVET